jgi:hypothetical protein
VKKSVKNSVVFNVKREGEDIARSDLLHELLIDPPQERQQIC